VNERGSASPILIVLVLIILAVAGYFASQMLFSTPEPEPKGESTTVQTPVETDSDPIPEDVRDPKPKPVPVRPTPVPVGPVAVPEPDALTGFVTDIHGNRLKGATVQVFTYDYDQSPNSTTRIIHRASERVVQNTATNDEGQYWLKGLLPGSPQYLRASASGYITQIKDQMLVGSAVNFSLVRGARVEGTVTTAGTGKPVVGALVRAFYKTPNGVVDPNRLFRWTEHVKTDESGQFVIAGAPLETVQFLIYDEGHPDFSEVRRIEEGRTNVFKFELKPGINIQGIVLDKMTEMPVANARVAIAESILPRSTVITDKDGKFTARGLNAGTQIFSITADQYTAGKAVEEVSTSDEFDPAKENYRIFRVDPAGRASGIVLDSDGRPLANARVFVAAQNPLIAPVRGQAEAITGPDGRFLVQNLGAGADHFIAVHRDGFGIGISETINVGPLELREDVTVRIRRGASIAGVVTSEDQTPISGARISVQIPGFAEVWFPPGSGIGEASTRVLVTGDDGRYSLDGLWRGDIKFDISHEAHVPIETQTVRITQPEEVASRDFRLQLGRSIAGIVANQTGAPGEGTRVTATRPWSNRAEAETTVDADGRFELKGLTRGNYRVQARKEGFSSEPMEDVPADTTNLLLTLQENGSLMGNVVSSGGSIIQSYTISMIPQFEETTESLERAMRRAPPQMSFSDPGGTFLAENIDPGVYVVTVRATGHAESITKNVSVPSGSVGNLGTVVLDQGATLTGTITDGSGANVRDATVTITKSMEGSDPNFQRAMSKFAGQQGSGDDSGEGGAGALPQAIWTGYPTAEGTYAITGITPGSYTVEVRSGRHVVPEAVQITIAKGARVTRNFELNLAATLTITIRDEVGDPVPAVSTRVLDVATSRPPFGVRPPSSDARGMVTVGNLAAGTYRVVLTRTGFIVHEETVEIQPGQQIRREIVLTRIR
jgi:protocatechuate 3,4-dioxygenase beta subunit